MEGLHENEAEKGREGNKINRRIYLLAFPPILKRPLMSPGSTVKGALRLDSRSRGWMLVPSVNSDRLSDCADQRGVSIRL